MTAPLTPTLQGPTDAEANRDFTVMGFSQAQYMKDFAEWRSIQAPLTFGAEPRHD
jgi:hypothetical protein